MEKDYEGIDIRFYKNDFSKWDKQTEIEYNNWVIPLITIPPYVAQFSVAKILYIVNVVVKGITLYNNNEIRQKEKYRFFQLAYDYLVANFIAGDYYEFGCHKARTFRMSLSEARKKNLVNINFYAFDSFEGLPEPMGIDIFPGWQKGVLKTNEDEFNAIIKNHGLYLDRIYKIKGFYNKVLTREFQKELLNKGEKIALVIIDCDLYESAVYVMDFIEPLLQEGSVLYFDDWNMYRGNHNKGEKKAFREFREKTSWRFEEFLTVGWFGKSFITINKS